MKKILAVLILMQTQFLILHCSNKKNNNKKIIQQLKINKSDEKNEYRNANKINPLESFHFKEEENPENNRNLEKNIKNNKHNTERLLNQLKLIKNGADVTGNKKFHTLIQIKKLSRNNHNQQEK